MIMSGEYNELVRKIEAWNTAEGLGMSTDRRNIRGGTTWKAGNSLIILLAEGGYQASIELHPPDDEESDDRALRAWDKLTVLIAQEASTAVTGGRTWRKRSTSQGLGIWFILQLTEARITQENEEFVKYFAPDTAEKNQPFYVNFKTGWTAMLDTHIVITVDKVKNDNVKKETAVPEQPEPIRDEKGPCKAKLIRQIAALFSESELRGLFLEMGIEYGVEVAESEGRLKHAEVLVKQCDRDGRLEELVDLLCRIRPNTEWD